MTMGRGGGRVAMEGGGERGRWEVTMEGGDHGEGVTMKGGDHGEG